MSLPRAAHRTAAHCEQAAEPPRRHPREFYLRETPEQFQRWPTDPTEEQRLRDWSEKCEAEYAAYKGPPHPLTPGDGNGWHDRRPDRALPPPPPPRSMEPHYPGLHSTQNDDVHECFKELHETFQAPFASPKWVELVNWRRREGEGGRLADGELHHLMHYLRWAEAHDLNRRGRGRDAYADWMPSPEEDLAANSELYHRKMFDRDGNPIRTYSESAVKMLEEHKAREAKRLRME